jgi:hypothetical protein
MKSMFIQFLKQLSTIKIPINGRIEKDWDQLINTIIFGNNFSRDVFLYKQIYFSKLRKKESALLRIQYDVYNAAIWEVQRDILIQEVENKLLKLEFLRYIYNTEAQKINPHIQVHYSYSIEIYNNAFFWVSKRNLQEEYILPVIQEYQNIYTKRQLLKLIKFANSMCSEIKFKFWKYSNFSHKGWIIYIPNQKYYNLQNIITLFFHELTHFFRSYNGEKNLWFSYQFAGYSTLEEGIAIYNEYLYWNKICEYGKFIPYYNICIQVLFQEIDEEEKKEKIIEILAHKWFSWEKSLQYYNRFYKYCELWWTRIFLKDLIYYNGYKNVKRLLRNNKCNYEKIMAWDIWIEELNANLISSEESFAHTKFFHAMVFEIKKIL